MSFSPLSAALSAVLVTSCALMPVTSATKLGDAASDLNTAARLGRMDVALDLVSAKAKQEFSKSHAGWGKKLRVVDSEFDEIKLDKKNDEASVVVTVLWLRLDDPTTRTTTVSQKWSEVRGNWILVSEAATAGDAGLFGEAEKPADPDAPPPPPPVSPRSRYQTHTISGDD